MKLGRYRTVLAAMAGLMGVNGALAAGEQLTKFTVRIENVAPSGAIRTSGGEAVDVVIAPGLWVVHTQPGPLYRQGQPDRGMGLEAAAEDGAPAALLKAIEAMMPASAKGDAAGAKDSKQADMPKTKEDSTRMMDDFLHAGVFNTRVGADSPGVVRPGQAYEFSIMARPGCRLSLVSMYVQSNDCFVGAVEEGIPLFDEKGRPHSGDMTDQIRLWDAGTEINQEPGTGPDQGARQRGHNVGAAEHGVVRPVNDGYSYPKISDTIRVRILPAQAQ